MLQSFIIRDFQLARQPDKEIFLESIVLLLW